MIIQIEADKLRKKKMNYGHHKEKLCLKPHAIHLLGTNDHYKLQPLYSLPRLLARILSEMGVYFSRAPAKRFFRFLQ